MKRIFTLLILAFISFSAMAQARRGYNQGRLTISSFSNNTLKVTVDGNTYTLRSGDDEILLNNLQAGQHMVQIYKMRSRRGNGNNSGWNSNTNGQLLYQSSIWIKSQTHTDILINRFGKAFVDEQPVNWNDDYNNNNQNPGNGGWNNGGYYNQTMDASSFEQFKAMLRNEKFDNSRLALAKQTVTANMFTSAQVKELVSLFSFDEGRLDMAKFAYKYTVDRNNYFSIYDSFSFSSSKEELARYIRDYRD